MESLGRFMGFFLGILYFSSLHPGLANVPARRPIAHGRDGPGSFASHRGDRHHGDVLMPLGYRGDWTMEMW